MADRKRTGLVLAVVWSILALVQWSRLLSDPDETSTIRIVLLVVSTLLALFYVGSAIWQRRSRS